MYTMQPWKAVWLISSLENRIIGELSTNTEMWSQFLNSTISLTEAWAGQLIIKVIVTFTITLYYYLYTINKRNIIMAF